VTWRCPTGSEPPIEALVIGALLWPEKRRSSRSCSARRSPIGRVGRAASNAAFTSAGSLPSAALLHARAPTRLTLWRPSLEATGGRGLGIINQALRPDGDPLGPAGTTVRLRMQRVAVAPNA
jgi:hypothetical protein